MRIGETGHVRQVLDGFEDLDRFTELHRGERSAQPDAALTRASPSDG